MKVVGASFVRFSRPNQSRPECQCPQCGATATGYLVFKDGEFMYYCDQHRDWATGFDEVVAESKV